MAIFNSHVSLPEGIAFLMRKLVCCKEPIFCPSPWSTMWWFFMADYLGSRLWSVMGAVILGTLKRKDRSAPSCTQTRIHTYLFIYIIMLIKTNIIIYIIINIYIYTYIYIYIHIFIYIHVYIHTIFLHFLSQWGSTIGHWWTRMQIFYFKQMTG